MRIAHFGTFDAGDFEGLLLPHVLERRLSESFEHEVVHVSPSGSRAAWDGCVDSLSVRDFLRADPSTDGVVLGGSAAAGRARKTGVDPLSYHGELWSGAARAALAGDSPLCWNAPMIPEGFGKNSGRLIYRTAAVSDYLSLREGQSLKPLEEAGAGGRALIVPDTMLDVPKIWPSRELSGAYEEAFARRGREVPSRTVVFHLAPRADEDLDALAARLDRVCRNAEATSILLPVGSHIDAPLLDAVARKMVTGPLTISVPRNLKELVACVAHCDVYVGSSLPGLVAACSFGRRGMLFCPRETPGAQEFLGRYGLSAWRAGSWSEAEELAFNLPSVSPTAWESVSETAAPLLDEHWDRLRSALTRQESRPAGSDAIDVAVGRLTTGTAAPKPQPANRGPRVHQDLETLDTWMAELSAAVPALFGTRRWRAGHLASEVLRRALGKPRTPTAAGNVEGILRQYRTWKARSGGGTVPTAPRGLQGTPEKIARTLVNFVASRRSLAERAESFYEKTAADVRFRFQRRLNELKPRVPKDELAREVRRRLGPVPESESWPLVSVVVVPGRSDHPQPLLSGLRRHTDYPNLEVVVVAGGSTDSPTQDHFPFEVRLVRSRADATGITPFSEAADLGARAATGDLLLFLDGGVEPFEAGWLKEMVRAEHRGGAAVGARLVDPARTGHAAPSGYALLHRGIRFAVTNGQLHARALGEGEDTLDGSGLGEDTSCPAVSAACLLTEREAFEAIGGFAGSGHHVPGADEGEDAGVDYGLRLVESGRGVVCCGRAVLFHQAPSRPSSSTLPERWGPRLRREVEAEMLGRVVGGGENEEGDGEEHGDDGSPSPSSCFWAEGGPHIAITVSSHDPKDGFGDWYTAHEIGDALRGLGWTVSYLQRKRGEWYRPPRDLNYLLALLEQYDPGRAPPGVTTIAWIRNWTERWASHPWFERFDVVLASSGVSKRIVEGRTAKAAHLFPIAANPERFFPRGPSPEYEADYVFTGNHWGEPRGVLDTFEPEPGETFSIFGKGWEHVSGAAPHARGHLPYDELPKVYSSSKVVIDDASSSTQEYGSVNSRVFDALASGTPVITSCVEGAREIFGDEFPTYSSRRELREQLDRLLKDPRLREETAERYRRAVLRDHTYPERARRLARILRERAEATGFREPETAAAPAEPRTLPAARRRAGPR